MRWWCKIKWNIITSFHFARSSCRHICLYCTLDGECICGVTFAFQFDDCASIKNDFEWKGGGGGYATIMQSWQKLNSRFTREFEDTHAYVCM